MRAIRTFLDVICRVGLGTSLEQRERKRHRRRVDRPAQEVVVIVVELEFNQCGGEVRRSRINLLSVSFRFDASRNSGDMEFSLIEAEAPCTDDGIGFGRERAAQISRVSFTAFDG